MVYKNERLRSTSRKNITIELFMTLKCLLTVARLHQDFLVYNTMDQYCFAIAFGQKVK